MKLEVTQGGELNTTILNNFNDHFFSTVERGLEPKDEKSDEEQTAASETTTSDEDYTRKLLIR